MCLYVQNRRKLPYFSRKHSPRILPMVKRFFFSILKMNKTKRIEIRLEIFEEKLLKLKARETGLSVSQYLRHCGLNKKLPKQLSESELEVYRDLKKFYNNFSSISNLLKKGDYGNMLSEISLVQQEILLHLKKIRHDK